MYSNPSWNKKTMKLITKTFLAFLLTGVLQILFFTQLVFLPTVFAWDGSKCSYLDQCVENFRCKCLGTCTGTIIWTKGDPCGSAVIGGIRPPNGVSDYNLIAMLGGSGDNIGIFAFISVGLRLFTILCGLFMFFNFLWAGYSLITRAGDNKAYTDVRERLSFAMIGLVVVVAAYMLAAMIGLIFFGDATFILQPDISRYSAIAPTTP